MTVEKLKERLVAYERKRIELVSALQTLDGAMQECQYWLGQIATMPPMDQMTTIAELKD